MKVKSKQIRNIMNKYLSNGWSKEIIIKCIIKATLIINNRTNKNGILYLINWQIILNHFCLKIYKLMIMIDLLIWMNMKQENGLHKLLINILLIKLSIEVLLNVLKHLHLEVIFHCRTVSLIIKYINPIQKHLDNQLFFPNKVS